MSRSKIARNAYPSNCTASSIPKFEKFVIEDESNLIRQTKVSSAFCVRTPLMALTMLVYSSS
jgi:hypothetical protein